jgi:RNA polymerase sigma factor (TIGR02999 family)
MQDLPPQPSEADVTQLLIQVTDGDDAAVNRLLPLVYNELRRLAASYLQRERAGHTLQATALVHEAWMRLVDQSRVEWQNRAHFFGVAAQMMRRILVDHARAHVAGKRGGGVAHVSLDNSLEISSERHAELIAIDEALKALAEFDAVKSKIVELRFFGGLSVEEVAAVLNSSTATVNRHWRMARAWLYTHISGAPAPEEQ